MRLALDRDLALLHRFEQGRLCLRWRPVDLVAEEQVGERRAGPELEGAGALVVDRAARDVGRHQIGSELDARELHRADLREGASDQRLRHTRVVLDQDVAVGEQPEQDELQRLALADHRPFDLGEHLLAERPDLL